MIYQKLENSALYTSENNVKKISSQTSFQTWANFTDYQVGILVV